jgi:hypothetical protein
VLAISMASSKKRSKALLDRIERAMGKALNREPVREQEAATVEFDAEAEQIAGRLMVQRFCVGTFPASCSRQ